MSFQISQWEKHFPDGVSIADYQRIGRIIRTRGMFVTITLRATDPDERMVELTAALRKIESGK